MRARTIRFKEWLRQKYRQYPASDLWRFRAHIPPFTHVPTPKFQRAEVDDAFTVVMGIAQRRQKDTPADASLLVGMAEFYMRCA